MTAGNEPWHLESFVDALVVELDKTRETLGVKAINQPLSYTVKDMSMDLQIFPTYNDDEVEFTTAQPGETGASKITLQLAAITDRQVRESTKQPMATGDIQLDEIDLEPEVRRDLRKIGVRSVNDLQRMEERDVNLESVTRKKIDFGDLANSIRSARRSASPPVVRSARLSRGSSGSFVIAMDGERLAVEPTFKPVATVNGDAVDLISFSRNEVTISCPDELLTDGDNEVVMALDPYSVVRVNMHNDRRAVA